MSHIDEVYRAFLASSGLATWNRCLAEYEQRLLLREPGAPASAGELASGLRVAIYVSWLGGLSGRKETQQHANEVIEQITQKVCDLHRRAPNAQTALGVATLMAWRGFNRTAETLLSSLGELTPDLALLVTPSGPAKVASFLRARSLGGDSGAASFLPALYFYCDALLELGSVDEVTRLIGARAASGEPLIRDLQGRLHERAGRWREAAELYGASEPTGDSTWPAHATRAAICRVVAAGPKADDELRAIVFSDAMIETLATFSPEINQSELARSSSFVDACRWNPFDNWLVHFELAKLNFRRRRYSVADAHFRMAEERCPPAATFAIAEARWVNLTWLTDDSGPRDLSMTPEALESAQAALDAAGDRAPEDTTSIRTWLASITKNDDLLPPPLQIADAYQRGLAHDRLKNRADAIECWMLAAEQSYHPRALELLISVFVNCDFMHAADFLASLVIKESSDDFFVLWELGMQLVAHRAAKPVIGAHLDPHLDFIALRLEELGRDDFQNLIRSFQFFSRRGREDRAAAMLRRAQPLAEGPEENLSLAVARRRLSGFAPGDGDPLGLDCLRRAESEAGDRLTRLEIARELGRYGRIQRARDILQKEGVFRSNSNLDPAEYIAAIQSAAYMTPEEVEALVRDVLDSHIRDEAAGIYRFGSEFLTRILDAVSDISAGHAASIRQALGQAGQRESASEAPAPAVANEWDGTNWALLVAQLDEKKQSEDTNGEAALLSRALDGISGRPLGFKLAAWELVSRQIDAAVVEAAEIRPAVEESKMPFSRSGRILDDWRAQEVTDLWRSYIRSDVEGDDIALRNIGNFYAEEERLLTEWEDRRRAAAAVPLTRALTLSEAAGPILSALHASLGERAVWPTMRDLHDAMTKDVAILAKKIPRQVEGLRRQTAAAAPPLVGSVDE